MGGAEREKRWSRAARVLTGEAGRSTGGGVRRRVGIGDYSKDWFYGFEETRATRAKSRKFFVPHALTLENRARNFGYPANCAGN